MLEILNPENYQFSIYGIPPMTAATINVVITLYILRKERNSRSVTYASQTIFLFLSSITAIFSYSSLNKSVYYFWYFFLMLTSIFLTVSMYLFSAAIRGTLKKQKIEIFIFYSFCILFIIINSFFPKGFVSGFKNLFFGPYPQAGPLMPAYLLAMGIMLVFAFVNFWKAHKEKIGHEKKEAKVILIAFSVISFGILEFLPSYGFNVYPLGFFFFFIYNLIIAYGIIRFGIFSVSPFVAFRKILENIVDYLVVINKNLTINTISASLLNEFGLPKKEFANQSIEKIINKNDINKIVNGFKANNKIVNMELNILSGKKIIPVSLNGSIIKGRSNIAQGYLLIMRDNTEILGVLEALQKKSKDLEQSKNELEKRNEELDKFNKIAVNREIKMIELKKKINELEKINNS